IGIVPKGNRFIWKRVDISSCSCVINPIDMFIVLAYDATVEQLTAKQNSVIGRRQRITSSVETARLVTEKKPDHQPKQALLIGSASNIKPLGDQERGTVAMALSVPEWKVPCGVFVCKKCLKPDIGFNGTVFACGETIIVLVDGKEIVVQLQGFWSVQNGDSYTLLGYGVCFPYSLLENGLVDTHYWSGFVKVLSKPLPDSIIFNVDNILRKVFLYPYNDTNFTVVDYMRQIGPSQLTVPVYPEKYDMVLIQGEAIGDVWYGHIQTVDHIEKTIEVYFFVPSRNSENIYNRETCGRRAKNTVSLEFNNPDCTRSLEKPIILDKISLITI
ncbi:hypothetical protein QZH41_015866, partial [Actinostola sp. cb2023]